jgi:protein-tyrosine phosphatase
LCFGSSGEPHDAATISSTGTLVIADVVRQALGPDGVRMRMSAHPVPQTLVDHLSDPLVFSGEEPANGKPLQTASELVARTDNDLELVLDDGPSRFGGPTTVVRADKSSWSVLREGVVSARTIARLACDVYLFVCTGNTCRSPMAEVLFRKLLADRLGCSEDALVDRGYVIESAGISAVLGCPPSPDAVETLRARGVNLHSHASQPLTERLLQHADYIFTMTHSHRESILWEHPEMAERVQVLARDNSDIPDPIGMGPAEYKRCADEIERHLRRILVEHVA